MKSTLSYKKEFFGKLSLAESANPLQTNLEFIFTDFAANKNKQGIPESEADNIVATGLYMPVKTNYISGGVKGHAGSQPVGPIIALEKSEDRVIGKAILWRDEFSDLDEYLREAFAESSDGVQFSWEVYHQDSEIDDSGVEWLKGCVVGGITIVSNPAYQGRTPLLALSEEKETMELEELKQALSEALAKIAELETKLTETQAYTDGIEAVKAEVLQELESLREYKKSAEATAIAESRKASLLDAGIENFESRKEFYCSLSDELFAQYVSDLRAVRGTKSVSSAQTNELPEPIHGGQEEITVQDIVKNYKEIVRG